MGRVEVTNMTKTRVLSRALLQNLVAFVLGSEHRDIAGTLAITFIDEENMRDIKRRFFQEDTVGDVVSFFYGEDPDGVWGEILVCVPRALEQSRERGVPLAEELMFLVVHGLLHLLGYDDDTEERRRLMMERAEELLAAYRKEEVRRRLVEQALRAREFAYAPYSRFRVGAALLSRDGRIFTGCNVENASFGVTMCAERVALGRAVAEGAREFTAIAVVSDGESFCFPCGLCRQALAEFGLDIEVLAGARDGRFVVQRLRELLPSTFSFQGV
uniref:Endoribonuclease YbeY n=1 Tax=Candidatus Caldatribacterium californiense TaxID=1454726 RepID=A0A7V3YKE9_9BACT